MKLEALVCDLDETLAKTYAPLSIYMANILHKFKHSGTHLAIITDEIEDNIDQRVSRIFRDKSRLHLFTDGGAVGFGFHQDSINEYYRHSFNPSQIKQIEELVRSNFGNLTREPDPSNYRYGIQIEREPNIEEIERLDTSLKEIGIPDCMSYLGNGVFRFNPFGKHKATEYFLELTGIAEENMMIIADQTAKFRNDWRMFKHYSGARRINVGPRELAMEDPTIQYPGENYERTTLSFLTDLKREIITEDSFLGNSSLYSLWIDEQKSRTGNTQEVVERNTRPNHVRYPILPEEHAIYLLPYIKKIISEPNSLPVVMARGMLPVVDVLKAIGSNIPGVSLESPLVIKTASFEDVGEYNPSASSRDDYFERDMSLAITINSLLGEEAIGPLTSKQEQVRAENGLKSDSLGGLIQEISSDCISDEHKTYLRKFYTANFYQVSFGYLGKEFNANKFVQQLKRLTEQEIQMIRKSVSRYDKQPIDNWEKVWEINQSAIKKFNKLNQIGYSHGEKYQVLRELLSETSFLGRHSNQAWVGIDDSQLTGRSSLLFRLIADAVSKRDHSFGVFSSTTAYGQNHLVDFVITDKLLFPEKEFELYDGTFRLQEKGGIWTYQFEQLNTKTTSGRKPDIQKSRIALDKDYQSIDPFFRRDTKLDPFKFILYNHLSEGKDPIIDSIVNEYLPNRNDNPHFIDLGSRMIEFSRNMLPWFEGKIEEYRRSQDSNPFDNIDMDSFRANLYNQFSNEITQKKEQYQKRIVVGVNTIANNQGTITDYFGSRIDFDTVRHQLVPQIYAE